MVNRDIPGLNWCYFHTVALALGHFQVQFGHIYLFKGIVTMVSTICKKVYFCT